MPDNTKKIERVPPVNLAFLRPDEDLRSPVGTWEMDAGIELLLKSGQFEKPLGQFKGQSKYFLGEQQQFYPFIRGHLRGAGQNALLVAHEILLNVDERRRRDTEALRLSKLRDDILGLLNELNAAFNLLQKYGVSQDKIERHPDQIVVKRGTVFAESLQEYIGRRSPGEKLARAPNSDVLMQRFLIEMRSCWFLLTRKYPPKSGGKILVKLAAGTWKDCKFPIRVSEKDRPLEDWLAERFKTSAPG